MNLRNICRQNKSSGFTYIEILVVIGILLTLLSFALIMGIDSYGGFARRSERDTIVSILERARSRAMANFNQKPWGVCYDNAGKQYVLFSGTSYTASNASNEPIPASPGVVISGLALCSSGTGMVFDELTGKLLPQLSPATSETTITIVQNGITSSISINNEGRING